MRATGRFLISTGVVAMLLGMLPGSVLAWRDDEGSNRPEVFSEPVEFTFVDEGLSDLCGAPIEVSGAGTVRTRWTWNRGLEIQYDTHTWSIRGTWTNLDTGQSLRFVQSGSDRLAFEVLANGDYTGVVTIYVSDHFMITVPGVGPVDFHAGRIVIEEVSNVIDQETFDWELVSSEIVFASREAFHDEDALCDALT